MRPAHLRFDILRDWALSMFARKAKASPFLVHENPTPAGPATHAIVIGVGDYPHLNGGAERKTQDHENMGQLTSPPVSARRFASWLIESFQHPGKPLATVSLLLSQKGSQTFVNPRTRKKMQVEVADGANTQEAIVDWIARGDTHRDNLLIFFFCGHGLEASTASALLLADYGANPLASLEGALDFRQFHLGMKRCKASEQCYFIDACRIDSETLQEAKTAGRLPIQPSGRGNWPDRKAPVFFSTTKGHKAYGFAGSPSIYTEALLQCLQDLAAQKPDGPWCVNTYRLQEAVDHVVTRKALEINRVVPPTSDNTAKIDLHWLTAPPKALVYIRTKPPEALRDIVSVACNRQGVTLARAEPGKPVGRELVLQLPTGSYEFSAQFKNMREATCSEHVYPIWCTLEFTP